MSERKCKSVIELSRYHVNDVVWWVVLRQNEFEELEEEDIWMNKHHPKTEYIRGPRRGSWPKNIKLPKLQHMDFRCIVDILTSKLTVEEFLVSDIMRCRNTGEFYYANDNNEWMPESCLADSKAAALLEKRRILRMFSRWTSSQDN